LKNNFFKIFILLLIINFKTKAQFLDKNYYLVDSIQNSNISKTDRELLDKQIKLYKKEAADTTKVQVLIYLIENLQNEKIWIRYNKLLFNNSSVKLSTIIDKNSRIYFNYKSAQALSLNNFGYYHFNYSNNYPLALSFYNQGLEINESIKNYKDLISSYSNVGNVYQNQGDLNKALIYFQKSLAFEDKVFDKTLLLAPLNNVAQVYFYLNDTLKALETLKRAFKISSKSDNNFLKASLLHNIGSLSYFNGDKSGIQTLKKALAFRIEIGDKKGAFQTTLSLAGIENNTGNYKDCERYLIEAKKLITEVPNTIMIALYYFQLGSYYSSLADTTLAINNFEKSISYYKLNVENNDLQKTLLNLIPLYHFNKKYSLKKLKAYELLFNVLKNIDKSNAQKLLLKQKFEENLKTYETKNKLEQLINKEKSKTEKHRQQLILLTVCVILFAVIIFSFFIFRSLKLNKEKNKIISLQKIEVEKQKYLIEEKHKDITDSITYAHRIQSSLIPSQNQIYKSFKNISIFFQPRDIVSGDFYWFTQLNNANIFALADCTGHGVPGAFMSIIGINQLNTLINEKGLKQPALILNHLKNGIINSLNPDAESDKKDGMDVALISFNQTELHFAGANQSVYILRNKELIELKGNKQPIGLSDNVQEFTEIKFDLLKNDRIILYSDGMVDQFGGQDGKKLKSKNLKNWLIDSSDLPLQNQKELIATKLNTFKQNYEQTDDITLAIIEI